MDGSNVGLECETHINNNKNADTRDQRLSFNWIMSQPFSTDRLEEFLLLFFCVRYQDKTCQKEEEHFRIQDLYARGRISVVGACM